jgi:ATP-dependent Clp protease ATP-binding subunit ClpA
MPRYLNPCIAGNPVGNSNAFIGRADVVRDVLHIFARPEENAIVLYGQRRIGKTSVLQFLQKSLRQEKTKWVAAMGNSGA